MIFGFMRRIWIVAVVLLSLAGAILPDAAVLAACNPNTAITRVSVSSSGAQANAGAVLPPAISGDGRFVAYDNYADNLVYGDINSTSDVFMFDRQSCTTTLVSIGSNGRQFGLSGHPAMSADGRYVAFTANFAPCLPGGLSHYDIWVRDRQNKTAQCASLPPGGAGSVGNADFASVSGDGRYIAFMGDGVTATGFQGAYRHDQQTGETQLLATTNAEYATFISGDGRYVGFSSFANGKLDVLVQDVQTGINTPVSVASDGTPGNGDSQGLAMTPDGRFVLFISAASNLVSDDTNGLEDVFVHDLQTGETTRESVGANGLEANGASYYGDISTDGRFVVFSSIASNLVDDDTNNSVDIFVRDRLVGQTVRLSTTAQGAEANGNSLYPSISDNGRYAVFLSDATNLVSGDSNHARDVFVVRVPDIFTDENGAPVRNYYTSATPVLTWSPLSGATGYEVQVGFDKDFQNLRYDVNTIPADVLTFSLPLADGLYYWRVRAKEGLASWGAWSTTDVFTVNVP